MKTKKTYCVYGMVINSEVDGKDYLYIGSGDQQEPNRRVYDAKNMHAVNKDIWDIAPKGEPVVSVLIANLETKKLAASVENEIVRMISNFPKKNLLLNKYNPRQITKYGRNNRLVHFLVMNLLFSIAMFPQYKEDLEKDLDANAFKVLKVLYEIGDEEDK